MYVNWLLDFIWRIFVQGPLMIINSITDVFEAIFALKSFDLIGTNKKLDFASATKGYLLTGTFIMAFILIIFLVQFILVFISESGLIKEKIIKTSKRLFKSFFLILLTPFLIMLFSLILDQVILAFSKVFFDSYKTKYGSSLAKSLYDVGYWGDKSNVPNVSITSEASFAPPSYEYLRKYNFALQILSVNFTMVLLVYMAWTFLQKIIEIFIIYISFPFAFGANLNHKNIAVPLWTKEILNKAIIALMIPISFFVFNIIILGAHNNLLNKETTTKVNKIIYTIMIGSCGSAIIFTNIFISKTLLEHSGFLGSYKSIKQTKNFINQSKNYQIEKNNFKNEQKSVSNQNNSFINTLSKPQIKTSSNNKNTRMFS